MTDWAYLSEMAVTNLHGGGITVQRVLGADVERFKFIYVGPFHEVAPPVEGVDNKSVYLPPVTELERVLSLWRPLKRLLGTKITGMIRERVRGSHWQFLNSRGLDIDGPCLVCPQSALALQASRALTHKRRFRYMTWMMDDHLLRGDRGRWSYSKQDRLSMRRHLTNAKVVAAISPNLANFYKSEFGVDATVLFGPCDPIAEPMWESVTKDGPIQLAYFGNVWPWQTDALAALLPLLDTGEVELSLYVPLTTLPEELRHPSVRHCDPLAPEKVIWEMRRFDAVVIPISFLPELSHLSHFNIATKMSECIASGTLTFAIGPADSAMSSYLEAHDAAILATSTEAAELRRAAALIRDHAVRKRVLGNARRLSIENLSTSAMQRVWRAAWARVVDDTT